MQAAAPHDHLGGFGADLRALPSRHVRRVGMLLAQAGLLLMAATFCVSIAALNIGLVAMLTGCLLARAPVHRAVGAWAFAAYLAWLALSTLVHRDVVEFGRTAVIPLGLVLAQMVLHPAVPGALRLQRCIAWAMMAAFGVALVLALTQFLVGHGGPRPFRIDPSAPAFMHTSGFFGHHQNHGAVMGMLFVLASATAWPGLPRRLAQGAAVVAVVISGSRASLLGLAAAAGALVALRGGRFLILGSLAGSFLLGSGLIALYILHPGRFARLVSLEDGRWAIWRASVVVAKDHPMLGTGGTRSFQQAYREVYPRVVPEIPSEYPDGASTAHNTHLSQAAEHGVPLAILWLTMLAAAANGLWQRRAERPAVFRAGIGLIVMALVYGQFEKLDEEPERTLWAGLGILLALSRHPPEGPPEPRGGDRTAIACG